jgi:hypothetical protein
MVKEVDQDLCKQLLDEKNTDEDDLHFYEEGLLDGGKIVILHDSVPSKGYRRANKKRSSCGGPARCLCKCALISLLVVSILTLFVCGASYFWVKDVVEHLTVTESQEFPVVHMDDAELEVLKDRVKLFVDQLMTTDDKPKGNLVITQDELNGLLGSSDYLSGHMQVTLEDGKILEEFSLPVDMLPGGKHRFFRGEERVHFEKEHVTAKLETRAAHADWFDGPLYFVRLNYLINNDNDYHQRLLELYLEEGSSFFGNLVPKDFIDQHQNLLDEVVHDPDCGEHVRTIMDSIESVSIEKGRIVVVPRPSAFSLLPEPAIDYEEETEAYESHDNQSHESSEDRNDEEPLD